MTILGIGLDMVSVRRFEGKEFSKNMSFYLKIFTEKEIEYCRSKKQGAQHWAARFAGKEAVIKALADLGKGGLAFKDIEILNDSGNVPRCKISKGIKELKRIKIKISLTHEKDYAAAVAVVLL